MAKMKFPKIAKCSTLAQCLPKIMKPFVFERSQFDIPLDAKISEIIRQMLICADLTRATKINQEEDVTRFKQAVYQSLDSDFDDYLIHKDNLERVLNAIHQPYPPSGNLDRRLQVQKSIMTVIGRLSAVNAAETMPQIRNMIVNLWKEIENRDPAVCRPAASLLQVLFESANHVQASLSVMPTLNLIMPLLKEELNDQVVCTLVDCIASMATVEGSPIRHERMMDIIDTILPFLSAGLSILRFFRKPRFCDNF